jgi:hypothetical protein
MIGRAKTPAFDKPQGAGPAAGVGHGLFADAGNLQTISQNIWRLLGKPLYDKDLAMLGKSQIFTQPAADAGAFS